MKESLKVSARQASLLGGLTVLFLLLFGLSGIICCVAADARGLTREMQRFAPPADTGLPEEIYPELGRHLSDYLTGKKESFQFLLEDKDGEERELFHDYELVHMADCRNLLQLARMLCICTGLLGAAGLVVLGALDSSVASLPLNDASTINSKSKKCYIYNIMSYPTFRHHQKSKNQTSELLYLSIFIQNSQQ